MQPLHPSVPSAHRTLSRSGMTDDEAPKGRGARRASRKSVAWRGPRRQREGPARALLEPAAGASAARQRASSERD